MTLHELHSKLKELQALLTENEVIEFKEANRGYDLTKLGKYFSALCNEANLKGIDSAWLIFGIRDKDKAIVGSLYRSNRADLDSLKAEIANKTTNRITFKEIYELILPEGRVVMFEIPAAPKGIPIAWEGHYYGRDGEELQPQQKFLDEDEEKYLKKQKLIEGRKPNFYISKDVAQKTGQKADYTKNKAFENTYYLDFIIRCIEQHTSIERKDVDELLWDKLPNWMSDLQKKNKINNLLSVLRIKGKIKNVGSDAKPKWILDNKYQSKYQSKYPILNIIYT